MNTFNKNNLNFYANDFLEIVEGSSSHSFSKHNHDSLCVGFIKSGFLILAIDNDEYFIDENTVYIIPPHIEHKLTAISNYQYSVLCIKKPLTNPYANYKLNSYISKDQTLANELLLIISSIKANSDNLPLLSFINKFQINSYIAPYNESINKILIYLKNSLTEDLDYNTLINISNYSKYHLIRKFKKSIGITPYQYFMQEKIREIKKELIKNQLPIDLTYKFNFTDQSHFCSTFKKFVGISPLQFKNSFFKLP